MKKIKAAFICDSKCLSDVYRDGRMDKVAELTELYPEIINSKNFDQHADKLGDIEAVFSTWGMPVLDDQQIDRLKSLKAVFYGAGAVKHFAIPYLRRGIKVISAWAANAVPVSEFVLAQILLGLKGYFRNTFDCRYGGWRGGNAYAGPGIYDESVALIGAGMIGRRLIGLLKPFSVDVLVVDPYLSDAQAAELGVTRVEMAEAFSKAFVVSNHLPNLESLQGVLDGKLFDSMRQGAVFINSGRGAQVNEAEMIEVFTRRRDLTALLDVTMPEPPECGSPMYKLENIHLSSHIAGSKNNEVGRLADCAIEEFCTWRDGGELKYSVDEQMLERMA